MSLLDDARAAYDRAPNQKALDEEIGRVIDAFKAQAERQEDAFSFNVSHKRLAKGVLDYLRTEGINAKADGILVTYDYGFKAKP